MAAHLPPIVVAVCAVFWYRRLNQAFRVFTGYLLLTGIVQLVALALWVVASNNMLLLHLYTPLGFALLVWFYRQVLAEYVRPVVGWMLTLLFVLFAIFNSVYLEGISVMNANALVVQAAMWIGFSLAAFYALWFSIGSAVSSVPYQAFYWINSGVFIYYTTSLVLFWNANSLWAYSRALNQYSWAVHALVSTIMYGCFFVGIWKQQKS